MIELDKDKMRTTCQTCGSIFDFRVEYLRRSSYDTTKCKDCKAKPVNVVKTKFGLCTPHKGDFDWDTMQPLKDGKPYLPGIRKCGNADCIARKHVITVNDLLAEQHSIEYRTGRRLTTWEFVTAIKKEKRTA